MTKMTQRDALFCIYLLVFCYLNDKNDKKGCFVLYFSTSICNDKKGCFVLYLSTSICHCLSLERCVILHFLLYGDAD